MATQHELGIGSSARIHGTDSSFSSSAPGKPFARSKTKGVGHSLGANSLACRSRKREHLACVKVELGRVRVKGEVKMPNSEIVVGFARRVKVFRSEAISNDDEFWTTVTK